jgi:hypothetical protein
VKSTPIRNPGQDIMLAPGSAALILIDNQSPQFPHANALGIDLDQFLPDGAVQSGALVEKH